MNPPPCRFCNLPPARVWMKTATTAAFLDGFPVATGHTLIIPKRHVASIFDLPSDEFHDLWAQVSEVRRLLAAQHAPDGFNIGVNDGPAAGQTVAHAHIHVIPRRAGDVPDPRGGIRWVIPERAKYW